MSTEVRYSREDFIKSFGKNIRELVEKYCDENPKDTYGHEDFRAVYYLTPEVVGQGGPVGSLLWEESQVTMDRLISTFEKNEWGE